MITAIDKVLEAVDSNVGVLEDSILRHPGYAATVSDLRKDVEARPIGSVTVGALRDGTHNLSDEPGFSRLELRVILKMLWEWDGNR